MEPLFAQFCGGSADPVRGLSQWGSVDLARDGMNPYEILQYYYGGDISIVFNAPVGGNVPSYPGRPLRRGDVGNGVLLLQRQLSRIRRNYPAIPEIPEPSTVFDVPMEEAVKSFQQIFNLTPDGVVGKATWYKIKQIYNGVKGLSELSGEGLTISEVQRQYTEALRLGTAAWRCGRCGFSWLFLGYFLPELPPIRLSDVFDQEMLDAVYAFQSYAGLPTDGVVGRDTWNALRRPMRTCWGTCRRTISSLPGRFIPGGSSCWGTGATRYCFLQQQLNRIAAQDPDIPAVAEDGIFRPGYPGRCAGLAAKAGHRPHRGRGPRAVGEDRHPGGGVLIIKPGRQTISSAASAALWDQNSRSRNLSTRAMVSRLTPDCPAWRMTVIC